MSTNKPNVLFLCTGNSARSQMAEALMRHYAGDRFNVYSAGLEAKGINPYAIRAMDELDIDIRGQKSELVREYMTSMMYRYLVTVCSHAEANCPQALWARTGDKLHWDFDDPAAAVGNDDEIMAKFREIRDQIDSAIKDWVQTI